jgi:hypothetical protein
MKQLKYIVYLFIFTFILTLNNSISAQQDSSSSLGVSPPYINNQNLLPGNTFIQEFVFSRSNPDSNATAVIEFDSEELASWIKFEPGLEIKMPKGESRVNVKAIISVPKDAQLREYKGFARVKLNIDDTEGQVILVPSIRLDINLTIGNSNISDLKVRSALIESFASGRRLPLIVKIQNNGNIDEGIDKIILSVKDINDTISENFEISENKDVNSFTIQDIRYEIKNSLVKGNYFASIEIFKDEKSVYKDTLAFEVTEGSGFNIFNTNNTLINKVGNGLMTIGTVILSFIALYLLFFLFKKNKKSKRSRR